MKCADYVPCDIVKRVAISRRLSFFIEHRDDKQSPEIAKKIAWKISIMGGWIWSVTSRPGSR
jgi:hypothetical protein